MKVYIVTQGDYSDYSIRKVFLDKEKAEKYAKYISTKYDEAYVEEYDTYDENFITKKHYIKCKLFFYIEYCNKVRVISDDDDWRNEVKYVIKEETNNLFVQEEFCDVISSKISYSITKYFDEDKYNITKALKKTKEIMYDICAEILEYAKEYNVIKVQEIIDSKYKHSVDIEELEEEQEVK